MVKLFVDLIQFLNATAPLLMAVAVLTLLAVLLAKSIKKHAAVYYTVAAIPFAMVAVPFVARWFGVEMPALSRIPLLGGLLRDYIHAGTLGFPLLIIIMYTGALNAKNPWAKRLLSIRKELSILSGFPILTHSLVRVTHNFPGALKFFTGSEGGAAGGHATSALGAALSNFSFVLGVLLLALFLLLWVTSFDAVHRRLGGIRWKRVQRWSYALYAMLFIHAMGIQLGAMLNPRERAQPRPAVEVTSTANGERQTVNGTLPGSVEDTPPRPSPTGREQNAPSFGGGRGEVPSGEGAGAGVRTPTVRGHQQSAGFADLTVAPQAKRYIHVASLLLIFGSYLYFRIRKSRRRN
jgi:DMSO/TMAO reductase YedYZ heme-binding membrane subunit